MGYGQPAGIGGRGERLFRPQHVPGTTAAGWGLVVLIVCAAFSAIGIGGADSSGVLLLGMFAGVGMVAYGVYRCVAGFNAGGGGPDGGSGRGP